MSDYEIIGRSFVFLGAVMLGLITLLGLLRLAWMAFKEVFGWPRIIKALRMLRASEEGDKP